MSRRPWPRGRASVSATRRIASVSVEGGQALSFADSSFDVVLCNLGLMFFPDPVRGLSEFRRVLRPGGRVAVSVNTVVERSYNHQINEIIARHTPSLVAAVVRTFAQGEASRLRSLFDQAGLAEFEIDTVKHTWNSAVDGQPPNDSVLTLRAAIDARCGEEFDSLLHAVNVGGHENIAF